MSSYKAIIFDCFGVVVGGTFDKFYETYFAEQPEKVERAQALDMQASRGEVSHAQFVAVMAEMADISVEEATAFLDNNPPNEPLLDYIERELKPHYKIGFLSNAAEDWLEELLTLEQRTLFDDFVLSFQHGIAKPDVAIFELAAERLGVETTECIFVDDVERYGVGAKRAGMTPILYSSFEQAKAAIEELLV